MNLSDFCMTYHGQKVDFDGVCGAQCVDLFRKYNEDVWDNPRLEGLGESGGAKDLWLKYDQMPLMKKYLCKVASPVCGDVVVFGATPTNKFGHVAIFLAQNGDDMLVFEQDGFAQNGAKYAWRSAQGMLGALRKRQWLKIQNIRDLRSRSWLMHNGNVKSVILAMVLLFITCLSSLHFHNTDLIL